MNVVLSALIIILLLYPGITFRAVYFKGRRSDGVYRLRVNILRQPIWEQVTASLIPALLIHLFCTQAITIYGYLTDFQINYGFLYAFLRNEPLPSSVSLNWYFVEFCGYLSMTFSLSLLAGAFARSYVSNNRLDTKITLLRFSNEWFYWLTGRILESDEDHKDRNIDLIAIHALAETKENTIVYTGFLHDFVLADANNGLDRIVLFNASKSVYKKTARSSKQVTKQSEAETGEQTEQSEYYERLEKRDIAQEYLVIPYSQIRNMTISYIDLVSLIDEPQ